MSTVHPKEHAMGTHKTASGHPSGTAITASTRPGSIVVCVSDADGIGSVVTGASVSVYSSHDAGAKFDAKGWTPPAEHHLETQRTDADGIALFKDLPPGRYVAVYEHYPEMQPIAVEVRGGCLSDVCFKLPLGANVAVRYFTDDCREVPCKHPRVGDHAELKVEFNNAQQLTPFIEFVPPPSARPDPDEKYAVTLPIFSAGRQPWKASLLLARRPGASAVAGNGLGNPAKIGFQGVIDATERAVQPIGGNIGVTLQRTATGTSNDVPLWVVIRNSTELLSFNNYQRFMDTLFCGGPDAARANSKEVNRFNTLRQQRFLPFTDTDAYRLVKAATEAFVMVNCGVALSDPPPDTPEVQDLLERRGIRLSRTLEDLWNEYLVPIDGGPERMLPYLALIRAKLPDVAIKTAAFDDAPREGDKCFGILQDKLTHPCLLELIWSYWQEEGMLVQTINAITRRFQNVRGMLSNDPLANLEIDPLRPLNNLLWGYLQDEQHRLSVVRRNYEYDHHYGLRLEGSAIRDMRAADTRSKFLEAFHHLLHLCAAFFKQDDDTTVVADGFPVLNGLKEVHLILSQGAHNQFGDLPSTARIEMLMQQWLMARPEFREFLPTRVMVAYPEPWMDRVDAMKKLQGWTDTSVLHFRNLALFGEQILLAIRYGAWSDVNDAVQAANWARFWRAEIQGYTHAYRSVTGADLTADRVDFTLPSVLLRNRLAVQHRSM
jgi:hypothetical protein